MDHLKARGQQAQLRPFVARHRGLVLFSVAAAGAAFAIRYRADTLRRNELAQKNSGSPNFYVSVDRSGGGI